MLMCIQDFVIAKVPHWRYFIAVFGYEILNACCWRNLSPKRKEVLKQMQQIAKGVRKMLMAKKIVK